MTLFKSITKLQSHYSQLSTKHDLSSTEQMASQCRIASLTLCSEKTPTHIFFHISMSYV